MSGLVKATYWKAPTVLLYNVASEKSLLSALVRGTPDAISVKQGVLSCLLTLPSRLAMYLTERDEFLDHS